VNVQSAAGPGSVRNLEVWRSGIELVKRVYEITRTWPKEEAYGLIAQARRAVVSVPSNLAEGIGRGTSGEAARFAQIALGSLYELDTLIEVAGTLGLATGDNLPAKITDLIRRISAFVQYQHTQRR
jgi:four helix bundle protein